MYVLQFLVTVRFNEAEIDEATVSEIFDDIFEGVYIDGIEDVISREA